MKANKNILVQFSEIANAKLDKAKKGEKIDRKEIVASVLAKVGKDAFTEMDGLNVLAVLVKNRSDFDTIKGPKGGTFKK